MKFERSSRILVLISLILILVFSTHISTAQNIKGVVLEEKSNKPLAGVNVYIKKTGLGTSTNENGEFHFKYFSIVSEFDTLNFSSIGYITKKITLSGLKENNYVVMLSESIEHLKELTVTARLKTKFQIDYTRLTPLKDGLYSFGSVLVDDKIWVIGGDETFVTAGGPNKASFKWENYSDKLYIYDISTDKWTTSELKFSKRAYHCIQYYNDKIYALGGKTLSISKNLEYLDDKIEVYDIKHNSILVDNTNPHQTVNFASFLYEDNLIVIGGSSRIIINGEKECSRKVHLINLKTGLWYELNDMPVAKETKGVLVNSTIYLIGGCNYKTLDNIETYNIATGEWKVIGQLFYGVVRPAVAYNDNIIYIFEDGRIQTYNIETKKLNLYSIDLPLKSSELFYTNNKLYILGGLINDGAIEPSPDLYRIDLSEFKRAVVYDTMTL